MTSEERMLGKKIESFRNQIPKFYAREEIQSYTSPHSNTFKLEENSAHTVPGEFVSTDIKSIMKTGSDIFKGTLLRRVVEGTQRKRVLELGTNTGFASSYFVSVDGVELVTIEGSEDLCKIADKNISRISLNFKIMHTLFDDAIDQLIAENQKFDCVFIDGQHEKEATIHYKNRLKPLMTKNAIFIFDDIYWSDGMNQAWKELFIDAEFSYGVDLQLIGVLQKEPGSKKTDLYDINDYLPRPSIFRKGW